MDELAAAQRMTDGLQWLDYGILSASILLLFLIAWYFGRRENDTRDYFIGGRKVPAAVACLSFVATEVSAVTIVSVPATAFAENWQYLQFFIGSAISRVFIAFLFIPVFYKFDCTTIYEFLNHRFGRMTQYAGSSFFFVTRLIASGVRLYAACLGVSVILGWSLAQSLMLFTLVSMLFIGFGGIKAVVWNGAYQAVMFYLVGICVIGWLLWQIQGGISEVWRVAGEAGRLSLFNFDFNLNHPTTFWAGTMNAFFVGLAVFGTDQELMQRLLTVKTRRSSQNAIMATIVASLPMTMLYLSIGTLLFVFYQQHTDLSLPKYTKEIFSHFTIHSLPMGLKGLVLAAIVLASIDSPLSSLSSSFVTDIYKPLTAGRLSEHHYLWISRLGVIGFGIILAFIAYACRSVENILWFAFQIISITGGSTLGVFLLGLLTKRRANRANVVAMIVSALAMTLILLLSTDRIFETMNLTALGIPWNPFVLMGYIGKPLDLAWSWLIVLGTGVTFTLGYILGPILDRPQGRGELEVGRE
jgi:SSS family transporter